MTKIQKSDTGNKQLIFEGDENPERGNWSGRLDFLLSCLGYAVGLGNVWRFPYLCYQNGGGAFLVPYSLMLLCLGLPIFLLELTSGQFSSMSPVIMFRHYIPSMRGIGVAMFLASAVIGVYYNVIIAWSVYYSYLSMTTDLPWQYCTHDFNTANCFSHSAYKECKNTNDANNTWWIYNYGRCITNRSEAAQLGVNATVEKHLRVSPAEEFFERNALALSDGVDNLGQVQVGILVSLLVAWLVVCAALIRGIKSSGKVVYFTALFPYVVLVILLVRGATLPGAVDGILFYIVPDWNRLYDVGIWEAAAVQIFYSLSICSGGLITLSSYNRFNNNVIRDTLIVCIGNCLTSVFAGFAVFSVLGFMAHELEVPVSQVITSGSGLAFVAYPDLVTRLPLSTMWALLFFLMLFTLGLDSQFAIVENIITSILDVYPSLRSKKSFVATGVCLVLFILGIPLTTQGGRYLIELLDTYAAGWPYLFIGLCQVLTMYWTYGVKNFFDNLYTMINFSPGLRLKSHMVVIYGVVCPLILSIILALSWSNYTPLKLDNYVFPAWSNYFGWCVAMGIIITIPLGSIFNLIFEQKGSFWNRIKSSLRPSDRWYEHSEFISKNKIRRRPEITLSTFDNVAADSLQMHMTPTKL